MVPRHESRKLRGCETNPRKVGNAAPQSTSRKDWRLKHGEYVSETFESEILTSSLETTRSGAFSSVHRKEIDGREDTRSVTFFHRKDNASGGEEGTI